MTLPRRGLEITRDAKYWYELGWSEWLLDRIALVAGELADAGQQLRGALRILESVGARFMVEQARTSSAELGQRQTDRGRAPHISGRRWRNFARCGSRRTSSERSGWRGSLELAAHPTVSARETDNVRGLNMMPRRTTLSVLVALLLPPLVPFAVAAAPAGKVIIAQGVDPSTLDLANQQETPAANVGLQIFERLFARDQDLKLVPQLASELPRLVSPTAWEIKLRRGIKFHNGEEFNAESVKFSLERVANPANKLRGTPVFGPLNRVEVLDPFTVRVHTKVPWPIFVKAMAYSQSAMFPPRAYGGKDSAYISKNPIGTGPYKFVRWVKDEEIVVEANASYWGGVPKIQTVVFRPIPDDAVRVAALQNGEIDLAVNIPPHLAKIIANHPHLFLSTAPSIRTIQLLFYTHQFDNQHKLIGPYPGPTADKRVRQAITSAIDADEIIKTVLDGQAIRVATMLTSMHFGFDPALKPVKKQDFVRTKKLLAGAGFPNGLEITLNGPQGRYVRDKEVAEALAGQLTKAGIRTTLRIFEFVNYLNNMAYVHKAGPIWLIGWGTSSLDAENVYVSLFRSGKILSNYHNPDFDRMLDEAQAIMDEKKRLEQYHRINRLWIDDAAAVPLYQQVDLYGARKRLHWKARSDELIRAYDMTLKNTHKSLAPEIPPIQSRRP